MASDTARHTAHISEREQDQAADFLNQALSALSATDQWQGFIPVAEDAIRSAMTILGMKEG